MDGFSGVAAGVSPAVEPGILPGGPSVHTPPSSGYSRIVEKPDVLSGRQDAALYGSQDGRRHAPGLPVESLLGLQPYFFSSFLSSFFVSSSFLATAVSSAPVEISRPGSAAFKFFTPASVTLVCQT